MLLILVVFGRAVYSRPCVFRGLGGSVGFFRGGGLNTIKCSLREIFPHVCCYGGGTKTKYHL